MGYYSTGAPLAIKDKIIVGIGGGEQGPRGFVDAYDPEQGKRLWRWYTVPAAGEPGSETWGPDSWLHGGGATEGTGSYDADLNLIYWGVGNPQPLHDGEIRPGDNLFTNSLVALDAETGRLKWYHQAIPHSVWDLGGIGDPILVDMEIKGQPPPKGGCPPIAAGPSS